MTAVAPADRPKSVRNSCVIERICRSFVSFYLCIICRLGVFVIRLRQISSLFSLHKDTLRLYNTQNTYLEAVESNPWNYSGETQTRITKHLPQNNCRVVL